MLGCCLCAPLASLCIVYHGPASMHSPRPTTAIADPTHVPKGAGSRSRSRRGTRVAVDSCGAPAFAQGTQPKHLGKGAATGAHQSDGGTVPTEVTVSCLRAGAIAVQTADLAGPGRRSSLYRTICTTTARTMMRQVLYVLYVSRLTTRTCRF